MRKKQYARGGTLPGRFRGERRVVFISSSCRGSLGGPFSQGWVGLEGQLRLRPYRSWIGRSLERATGRGRRGRGGRGKPRGREPWALGPLPLPLRGRGRLPRVLAPCSLLLLLSWAFRSSAGPLLRSFCPSMSSQRFRYNMCFGSRRE